jgi:plasmid stabilization system protein ParE
MKKYKVILHPEAELDIESSFKWGCRAWGEENARSWVRKLWLPIRKQLTTLPLACPLAPESEELRASIRHLIVGRYRVLFTVRTRTVYILHVRGPYISASIPDELA